VAPVFERSVIQWLPGIEPGISCKLAYFPFSLPVIK
jgi:hypothetical protein